VKWNQNSRLIFNIAPELRTPSERIKIGSYVGGDAISKELLAFTPTNGKFENVSRTYNSKDITELENSRNT